MATTTRYRRWTRPQLTDLASIEATVGVPLDDADADVQAIDTLVQAHDLAIPPLQATAPTALQKEALAGTSGRAVNRSNPYVDSADRRLSFGTHDAEMTGSYTYSVGSVWEEIPGVRRILLPPVDSVFLVTATFMFSTSNQFTNEDHQFVGGLSFDGVMQTRVAALRRGHISGQPAQSLAATVSQTYRLVASGNVAHTITLFTQLQTNTSIFATYAVLAGHTGWSAIRVPS